MRLLATYAAIAVCAFALSSCADRSNEQEAAPTIASAEPEIAPFGLALEDMDAATRPGDDFFRHVNGGWLDRFVIPDEYASYGSFTALAERAEEDIRAIAEEALAATAPQGSLEQKIGDFYAAFLDQEAIDSLGLAPLNADLARIASLSDHAAVAYLMGDPELGLRAPFRVYVDVDAKRPDRYAVYLGQSGLGMPNRNYYVDEKFAEQRTKYAAYVGELLGLAGVAEADTRAASIVDLEMKIARIHWTPEKQRNRDLTYNLKSVEALKTFAPGMAWDALFAARGLADLTETVVREDDAVRALAILFAETPVETWRDYLAFHLLNDRAEILPRAFDDAKFRFFGTTLRGTPEQRDRWKRAVDALNGALGEAVGEAYVARRFPPASKTKMDELVANLQTAMDQRIASLAWMSDATKEAAKEKLAKFTPKIGFPERWKDYSEMPIRAGDAYGNARAAREWRWSYDLKRLRGPVDRTEWFMNPQTVNAYYSSTRNEIVFPAAILQAPFFDPNADPAVNYGAIGAVIGHEIGHGFDDQGRKSDGDGVLRDWWTQEDAARFSALAERLGDQYARYEPIEGFPVNPQLTMGENIGDLGGLSIAYHAYKLSLGGEEAPVINGLTGDQRFFMAWAQVWKRKVRDEALRNQIATDPHSPAEFRVNGVVRNMDAWYEAFDVEEGDRLYLPAEERVTIW